MESVQGKQAIKTQIWAMENGKKTKKIFTQNNFAKGRHRVLSPLMGFCVCLAYTLHAQDVHY